MSVRVLTCLYCFAAPALADPPDIVGVDIDGSQVSVTIGHPDSGWDHYADGWRVETEDGTVIGTRDLLHPHVNEQPFTRSLGVSDLPDGPLYIRARCSVDGWSEDRVALGG
ncbi:hypothetical protein [Marivita sp.]|uniref:hypothetical protein n=1 Tax=Marivita sp. TaxID=2003365 RepID=UPI0025B80B08|nr:hypothetical protein [Marivita sp.]